MLKMKQIFQVLLIILLLLKIQNFEDQKYIYILLEYIGGGELFNRLRRDGRFSVDVTLFYCTEILVALKYLHDQNIIYRDLKPENVMIKQDGHIKLIDFGFSKKLIQGKTFTLCGTPEYIAPEVLIGQGYGKPIDMYFLLIQDGHSEYLFMKCYVGTLNLLRHPPFYGQDPQEIQKAILKCIIELPEHLDNCSKDLIIRLLNPDENRRLGSQKGIECIQKHKFFQGVNWNYVYHKKIPSPWCPYFKNQYDTQWFTCKLQTDDSFDLSIIQ